MNKVVIHSFIYWSIWLAVGKLSITDYRKPTYHLPLIKKNSKIRIIFFFRIKSRSRIGENDFPVGYRPNPTQLLQNGIVWLVIKTTPFLQTLYIRIFLSKRWTLTLPPTSWRPSAALAQPPVFLSLTLVFQCSTESSNQGNNIWHFLFGSRLLFMFGFLFCFYWNASSESELRGNGFLCTWEEQIVQGGSLPTLTFC